MVSQSPCASFASFPVNPSVPYTDNMFATPNVPFQPFGQQQFPQQQFLQQPGGQMMVTPQQPSGTFIPGTPGGIVEQSYVENILRMNLGKVATIYMTFENNSQWNAKVFRGVLEAAGRDHIIISDPQTGMRYLLLTVNLDYITFDEPLNYVAPSLPQGIR